MARPKEYVARTYPVETGGPAHGRVGEMSEAFLIKCEEELSKLTEKTARSLTDDMISLFESELHSDLIITNGIHEVKAHKCLLQLRAKHIWQEDWLEQYVDDRGATRYVVKMQGCDGRRMREFIRQLYAVSDSGLLMEEHLHFFQGGKTGTISPDSKVDSSHEEMFSGNHQKCKLEPVNKDVWTCMTGDEQNSCLKAADVLSKSVENKQNCSLHAIDTATDSLGLTTHIIAHSNGGNQNSISQTLVRSSCPLSGRDADNNGVMPNSLVENGHGLVGRMYRNGLMDLSGVAPAEEGYDSSQSFLKEQKIENGGSGIHDRIKEEDSLKAVVENVTDWAESALNGVVNNGANFEEILINASLNNQEQNSFRNTNGYNALSPNLERENESDVNSENGEMCMRVEINSGTEAGTEEVKEEGSKEGKDREDVEKPRCDLSDVIKESYSLSVPYKCCSPLASNLLQMYLQEKNCDCCLSVDGVKFLVHKCVLSCRCEYFQAMLGGSWHESTTQMIPLEGVTAPAVEQLLLFLYGGVTELVTASDLFDLFVLADMYGVDSMKSLLVFYLKKDYCHFFHRPCSVCSSTAADAINLCYSFNLVDVQDRCLRWMSKFFTKVWPTKSFSSLPEPVHQLCVQGMLSHMTEANVLDIIMECNKLTSTLPRVKWTEPVLCLITQLMDSAIEFTSKNFIRVLKTEEFLAWGKVAAWKAGALEEIFNSVIDSLPVETACAVYQTLENLKAFQMQMEIEQDVLDLLDLMIKRCEKFLKTHILQVARSKPWSSMDKSIQDKILQKSSYFSLADYPGPKPKIKLPPKATRTRPLRGLNPSPDVRNAKLRNPQSTSAKGRDVQSRKGDEEDSSKVLVNVSASTKGNKVASVVLGQRKFTVGVQKAERPTTATVPKAGRASSDTEKTKRSSVVSQKAEKPTLSNQKVGRPASSNQKTERPALSNQKTERPASYNQKTEKLTLSTQKAEKVTLTNVMAGRKTNQKPGRPISANVKSEEPTSASSKAENYAGAVKRLTIQTSSAKVLEKPSASEQNVEKSRLVSRKVPLTASQSNERSASPYHKPDGRIQKTGRGMRKTDTIPVFGMDQTQRREKSPVANQRHERLAQASNKAQTATTRKSVLSCEQSGKSATGSLASRNSLFAGRKSQKDVSLSESAEGTEDQLLHEDTVHKSDPLLHEDTGCTSDPLLHEDTVCTSDRAEANFQGEKCDLSVSENVVDISGQSVSESVVDTSGQSAFESVVDTSGQSVFESVVDTSGRSVSESTVDTSGQSVSECVVDCCDQCIYETEMDAPGQHESVVETCFEAVSESVVETCGQPTSHSTCIVDTCSQTKNEVDICGQSESVVDTCDQYKSAADTKVGQPGSQGVGKTCGQSDDALDTCLLLEDVTLSDMCCQSEQCGLNFEDVAGMHSQSGDDHFFHPCGQSVSEGTIRSSECWAELNEAGQSLIEGEVETSGQSLTKGKVETSGQSLTEEDVETSGQSLTEGEVETSGQSLTEGEVETTGQSLTEGEVETSGQSLTEGEVETSGQSECDGAGKSDECAECVCEVQTVNGMVSDIEQAIPGQENLIPEEAVNSTGQSQDKVIRIKNELLDEPRPETHGAKGQPNSDVK